MKLLFLLLTSFLLSGTAIPQEDTSVTFNSVMHDFGDFGISDGPKTHTFTLTNNSDKPLVIQTVITSCGCTVPEWTREPILPGASGSIQVTYSNDQGPYPFDKMLSVYITGKSKPYILRVRGVVHQKKFTLEDTHPVVMGTLRLRSREMELGQIRQGTVKTDSVEVINTGRYPLFLKPVSSHANLSVSASPFRLNPMEKGSLVFSVDTRKKEEWGNVLYTVRLLINDKEDPFHVVTVKGSIKLNTSGMSRSEKERAPIPQMNRSAVEFPLTAAGSALEADFVLSNKGKSPLIIYKIDTSHDGIAVAIPRTIAPGSEAPVKVSIPGSVTGDAGEVIYTISLTTNAPSRPTVNLLVYGKISP